MVDSQSWDWNPGEKKISLGDWKENYQWVEEPYVSPDGEKIASIVNIDEGEFTVCVNGQTWGETVFDKIWHLRFVPDGRLTAIVSEMGEWTMAVDGEAWENKFGYTSGNPVSAVKTVPASPPPFSRTCGTPWCLNGKPWEQMFSNMTYFCPESGRPAHGRCRAGGSTWTPVRDSQIPGRNVHGRLGWQSRGIPVSLTSGIWPSVRTAGIWPPKCRLNLV